MSATSSRPEGTGLTPQRRGAPSDDVLSAAVHALELWRGASGGVTIVAIDGHGASGKSTIAEGLCARTGASLVRMDDFFVPPVQQVLVAERGEPAIVKVSAVGEPVRGIGSFYDVKRLRVEGLEPLRAGHEAVLHAFDWDLGTVAGKETRVEPSDLVMLEGVYSGAPELRDLVDRAIYVDTPETERLRRLRGRVTPEEWDEQWLWAEREYFAHTRPLESFDLVIPGIGAESPAPARARAPGGGRCTGIFDSEAHRQ